jgi:CBS-domain-containing membrane protein
MITLHKLKVKEAHQLRDEKPILLKVTDEFDHVIKNFAQHAELRGLFVIDKDSRFIGVITRTDLLDWTRAKLGKYLLKPLTDMDKSIRVVKLIRASTVGDILRSDTINTAINENDTLDQALRIMVDMDLILLPVVDESHRLVGSLSLSEILNIALIEG